jgi:hypothetical protein
VDVRISLMYTAPSTTGDKMALRHYVLHDKKNKLVVYEEMIDGKSYIFIRCNGEVTQMPTKLWRKVNTAWQENGWSEKWDMLDDCIPPLEQ